MWLQNVQSIDVAIPTGRPYSSTQSIHTTGTVRDWYMILSNGKAIVIIVIMIRKECQKLNFTKSIRQVPTYFFNFVQ